MFADHPQRVINAVEAVFGVIQALQHPVRLNRFRLVTSRAADVERHRVGASVCGGLRHVGFALNCPGIPVCAALRMFLGECATLYCAALGFGQAVLQVIVKAWAGGCGCALLERGHIRCPSRSR
jgi:hypothetical protein